MTTDIEGLHAEDFQLLLSRVSRFTESKVDEVLASLKAGKTCGREEVTDKLITTFGILIGESINKNVFKVKISHDLEDYKNYCITEAKRPQPELQLLTVNTVM